MSRVLFYSHDTFGLGHIRRTQKIANALACPGRSILIACSSPVANAFSSQAGIEYCFLPGFTKRPNGEYEPRSHLPLEDFVSLRSNLLLTAAQSFRPELFVVDKEPLGVKKELLPALRFLKGRGTRIVCGFRDILDEKEKLKKEWGRKGVVGGIEEFYDHLLVYGEKDYFDFGAEYDLPESVKKKLHYTGYLLEGRAPGPFALRFAADRPLVTLTIGGGGDGWDFVEAYLEIVEKGLLPGFNFAMLAGPFARASLLEKAEALALARGDFRLVDFTANAPGLFARSRLVLTMGGYNSVCEILELGKFPLILPRVAPREEQLLRAKVFRARGLCDYLEPAGLSAEGLARKMSAMLRENRSVEFRASGLARTVELLEGML
jgi:predicted glycosyltransferase